MYGIFGAGKKGFYHRVQEISYIQELLFGSSLLCNRYLFLPLHLHEEVIALQCIWAMPEFIIY